MFTFLLWCLLFVLCWPLALLALVLYPIRVAAAPAVPADRDCGAWSLGVGVGSRDAAGETFDRAVPDLSSHEIARAYSAPFAGIAIPNSFITICKSFQVSFFWRGSRSRNAG